MSFRSFRIAAAFAAAIFAGPALAQAVVLDQDPAPVPSPNNANLNSELLTQSYGVPGGTLYIHSLRQPGQNGLPVALASNFVPSSQGGLTRYQALTNAKADTGVDLTASATGGAMGVSRTAGTSLDLVGEATSANGKTDKALWELNVADSYVTGQAIPITVNANYTGSGTVTAANTTLTVNAYTEVNGVETAISGITAAQQFTGTATNYTFTIPGAAGLTPGAHIVVEIVMLVTTSANALTGQINSVAMTM
ncbi:MAG: hypothetical protein P4M05_19520 [Bradyrhizobium sp.]|nr:hypothetical protein [Bradyrhizobium sp.]